MLTILYYPSILGGGNLLSASFNVRLSLDSITQKLLDTGLTLVKIQTVDGEEPVCEYIHHPEDCVGKSITNATKVPGNIVIMKDTCVLYNSGEFEKDKSGMTVKIRGNTSAYGNKKPYKIKLQKSADLLNRMNNGFNDKNWLLICDEDLNAIAGFKSNDLLGLQWTPSYKYVNLMLNGDYKGVYMLVESVNRNPYRLNVNDTGYIFEFDAYWWNEKVFVMSPTSLYPVMNYTFKYPDPDVISKDQLNMFLSLITDFEESLINGTYSDYIDVESFASWILCHDILGCGDPAGSNIFLTKRDNSINSKIQMANLWDFSDIFATKDMWSLEHLFGVFCYNSLFNNKNKLFVNTYKQKWVEIEPKFFEDIDIFLLTFMATPESISLDNSLKMDSSRWGIDRSSVSDRIETMRSWFKERREWLSTAIGGLSN